MRTVDYVIVVVVLSAWSVEAGAGEAQCVSMDVDTALGNEVVVELDARLRHHGLSARARCPGEALATVKLRAESDERAHVSIDIADALTVKRVGRDVDLTRVPAEERSHLLAIATEELLQASWLEIEAERREPVPTVQRERPTIPAPVRRMVRRAKSDPAPLELGLQLAADTWTGGSTEVGGGLWMGHGLTDRVEMTLSLDARKILPVSSDGGTIDGSAWGTSALAALRVFAPWNGASTSLAAGLRLWSVRFEGESSRAGIEGRRVRMTAGDLCVAGRLGVGASAQGKVAIEGCRAIEGADAGFDGRSVVAHGGWKLGVSIGFGLTP